MTARRFGFLLLVSSFVVGAHLFLSTAAATETLIPAGATWKYSDTGTDYHVQGWPSVDDSGWASGAAQLGFGDGDEATTLSYGNDANNKYPCYYFRYYLEVANPDACESLTLKVLRDDGCIVYFNDTEVGRSNMPSGPVYYTTYATSAIEDTWDQFSVTSALLVAGTNVIAVEIHQCNATSSDLSFDLELLGEPPAPEVTLVSPEDESIVGTTTLSFTCSATDISGLSSATLYIGNQPQTFTFSGAAQTEDAQITATSPDTNTGDAITINVDGENPHAHGVIKFLDIFGYNPGQIPPGASVVSATLEVNCTNTGNAMKLYRLTEDWVESEITWNQRASGLFWSNAGADGSGSHADVEVSADCSAIGWRTIDVTYFVQEWSNGQPNYGVVLIDSGTDGVDFDTSESANPPILRVSLQTQWQPVGDSQPMSGTSDTVTFYPVTLDDQTSYVWNCLVTNISDQSSWAPADFHLTVDTHCPNEPVLVAPEDGETGVSTSPTLEVTVSDPDGDNLDVTFYGRGGSGEEFTIIALPDTQKYVLNGAYPQIFTCQTQWIKDSVALQNIVFVTHEGDIVDTWNNETEWTLANNSMSVLETGDGGFYVPYGVLPGNHDMSSTGDATYYNQTFPYTRYQNQPWYGGHYPEAGNEDNYQLFSAGGEDFIILHLQYAPTSAVFTWANSVLAAHADRKAIITTHDYMETSGARSTNGTNIWNNVVVPNSNVYFVLCGHNHDEATRSDWVGDRQVHQLLADYQDRANGGDGWLRIMRFVPAEDQVYVQTYSPWLDQYETDSNSQFTLDFAMSGFSEIGSVASVPSGSNTSTSWPGLSPLTVHEWYASVMDTTGKTRVGPVWQFTTETDDFTPPTISGVDALDITDNSARIVWTTDELADSLVDYGPDTGYGSQASDPTLVTSHSITLTGLEPNTLYHYLVSSKDNSNNVAYSGDYEFTTPSVNYPPVAADDVYATDEDITLSAEASVLSNDTDPNGDPMTAILVTGTSNGVVILNSNGFFTYTPDADFNGTDSFTYKANDGLADSNLSTVTITVTPVNDAPVAVDDAYEVDQDTVLTVAAPGVLGNDSDVDRDTLTPVLVVGASNGALTVNPNGSFTYTPDPGYWGTDSFTYKASDGSIDSNEVTVTITVNRVNHAPVAANDAYTVDEDGILTVSESALGVLANDFDPDNDPLTAILVTGTSHGSVVLQNDGSFTYTPDANFNGTDSFTYKANDGLADSNLATVSITVTPVNDPPAAPANLTATAGVGKVTLDWADGTDPEGDLQGYNVYRSTAEGGPYDKINGAVVATSAYVDAAVVNGTAYYYVVTAVDSSSESSYSNEASATPYAQQAVHVQDITMTLQKTGKTSYKASATVLIHDQNSTPRSGARVVGDWYFKGTRIKTGASGRTNSAGKVTITSPQKTAKTGDTFTFKVTKVTLSGYPYAPEQNVETEDSISVP